MVFTLIPGSAEAVEDELRRAANREFVEQARGVRDLRRTEKPKEPEAPKEKPVEKPAEKPVEKVVAKKLPKRKMSGRAASLRGEELKPARALARRWWEDGTKMPRDLEARLKAAGWDVNGNTVTSWVHSWRHGRVPFGMVPRRSCSDCVETFMVELRKKINEDPDVPCGVLLETMTGIAIGIKIGATRGGFNEPQSESVRQAKG